MMDRTSESEMVTGIADELDALAEAEQDARVRRHLRDAVLERRKAARAMVEVQS